MRIAVQYSLVCLLTMAALLPLQMWKDTHAQILQYILAFAVMAFSAWYVGMSAALLSVSLVLGIEYWFSVGHTLQMPDTGQWLTWIAFVSAATLVTIMGERRRRQNEVLRNAQAELEDRVRERTAQLHTANSNLRDLSARLLQLQDEERRRIARELHDSVGQLLVGLSLNVANVRTEIERLTKAAAVLSDSDNLIQQMSREVRTISHLLHPPLLDEAGLVSAIRWYLDGFAQRSHMQVELDCPEDFGRLPRDVETAMFRVVQESVTNIHRHSGSQIAKIRCRRVHDRVVVEIKDSGAGMSAEKLSLLASDGTPGVGIRGMRERLRQLGGDLEITSGPKGTVVKAGLPIQQLPVANASEPDASQHAAA